MKTTSTNNDTTQKVLTFEGAGWAEADHNGVGNCRIRTTFKNRLGEIIYLEMTGHQSHGNSPKRLQFYVFPWHLSHIIVRHKKPLDAALYIPYQGVVHEYTLPNILRFVNTELSGDFTEIKVINDGSWNGFSLTGDENDERD